MSDDLDDWLEDNPDVLATLMRDAKLAENGRKERAYAAVYELIGEACTPAETNALIWRCVHAALDAYTEER